MEPPNLIRPSTPTVSQATGDADMEQEIIVKPEGQVVEQPVEQNAAATDVSVDSSSSPPPPSVDPHPTRTSDLLVSTRYQNDSTTDSATTDITTKASSRESRPTQTSSEAQHQQREDFESRLNQSKSNCPNAQPGTVPLSGVIKSVAPITNTSTTNPKGLSKNIGPNAQPGAIPVSGVATSVGSKTTTANPKGLSKNSGPNTQPGAIPVSGVATSVGSKTTTANPKGLSKNSGPNTQPGAIPVSGVATSVGSKTTTDNPKGLSKNSGPNTQPGAVPVSNLTVSVASASAVPATGTLYSDHDSIKIPESPPTSTSLGPPPVTKPGLKKTPPTSFPGHKEDDHWMTMANNDPRNSSTTSTGSTQAGTVAASSYNVPSFFDSTSPGQQPVTTADFKKAPPTSFSSDKNEEDEMTTANNEPRNESPTSNIQNKLVALEKIGLSKKTHKNSAKATLDAAAAAAAVATPPSHKQNNQTGGTEGDASATTSPIVTDLNDSAWTASDSATTGQAQGTITNPTVYPNGLSKKTPKARDRAVRAGAVAISNQCNIDANTGRTIWISGIIPHLHRLSKNQPPAKPKQKQKNRASTERGLRKNRQTQLGYHNQIQNEVPPRYVPEGSIGDEKQKNPKEGENASFLPSPLDASPSERSEPIENVASLSYGQPQDEESVAIHLPSTFHRGDTRLAVARAIEDDDSAVLVEAQEVDPEEIEKQEINAGKRKECRMVGYVIIAVSISIMAIVLGVKLGRKDEAIASPPTDSPSMAPSAALDLLMESLPEQSIERICCDTPQYKAWDWLKNHPNISNFGEWRKRQLFAVSTFYYSMEGEKWNQLIRERWMDYEKGECLWFSSGFGLFNSEREYYELPPENQVPSCNDDGEFTSLYLQDLQLAGFIPRIPPEVSLLTSLSTIGLIHNGINASLGDMLPSELIQLTTLTRMELDGNALFGLLPTELGMMYSLANIHIFRNSLTGPIPSEVGRMTDLADLQLSRNNLTGSLPSELGLTKLTKLFLFSNKLTGSIPSEIGRLTGMELLPFHLNHLTGVVPSELGSLVNITRLYLHTNRLFGSLPSELALLKNLLHLRLEHNSFNGKIPLELDSLRVNGSLKALTLANNSFSGVVPEGLCSLGLFDSSLQMGLSFDCGGQLCGCCWCPCPGNDYGSVCETRAFVPSRDDNLWPGSFPTQLNGTNTITINVRTNDIPRNYAFEWNVLTGPGTWTTLNSRTWGGSPKDANSLHSYNYEVESDTVYMLHLFDKYDDGKPMCCTYGFGWFAITSAVPSDDWKAGTVVWEAAGDSLRTSLDVFLQVDSSGIAHHVEHLPGEGQSLSSEHPRPVLADNVTNDSELENLEMDNASSSSKILGHEGET